jgi:hypothetical protein
MRIDRLTVFGCILSEIVLQRSNGSIGWNKPNFSFRAIARATAELNV